MLNSHEGCVRETCRGRPVGKRKWRGLDADAVEEKAWEGRGSNRRKGESSAVSLVWHACCRPERTSSEVLPVPLSHSDSAGAPGPEHLSQCQNLTLYRSFCAMKYAIYALCVNSHQHTQCQECKDSLSEDLAVAAEPGNDSVSPSGTETPPPESLLQPVPPGLRRRPLVLLCPGIISSINQPSLIKET